MARDKSLPVFRPHFLSFLTKSLMKVYPKIPLVTHLPFYREEDRAVDTLYHSGPPKSLFKDVVVGGGNSALSMGSVVET